MHASRLLTVTAGLAVASLLTLVPRPASANGPDPAFITTSYVLPIVVGVAAGAGTTVFFKYATAVPPGQQRDFMRRHGTALRQELTVGAGPALERLAAAFHVPPDNRDRFGDVVREHRSELLPLLDRSKLDESRAEKFFTIVARAVSRHPDLRTP